jgi:hypothetical protein
MKINFTFKKFYVKLILNILIINFNYIFILCDINKELEVEN